jgi:hypothetical protein
MSAKTASDAEIRIAGKIDELAAQVKSLKESLAKDEAALAGIRASNQGRNLQPTWGRGDKPAWKICDPGEYVSGIQATFANEGHSDSALANLILECRKAAP